MGSNIDRLDRRFSRPGIRKHPTQQAGMAECEWRPQRVGNLRAKKSLSRFTMAASPGVLSEGPQTATAIAHLFSRRAASHAVLW